MVNIRGALRGLGAGLAYLGQQGMAEQQRVAADQRLLDRERAFATFQQGIRNQDADTAVGRSVDEMKAQAPHIIALEEDKLAARAPYAEADDARQAAREEARDERTATRAERAAERADARALAAEDRRIAAEDRRAGRTPIDTVTGEDGFRHYRYADGSERVGTVQVRQGSGDDGGDSDTSAGGAMLQTGARTARSSRPTLSPRGTAPIRVRSVEEARSLPSGTRFIGPDGHIRTHN